MINYETILSLFDDKLTLLEYLTKIEKALKDSTLTEITIEQPTETTAVFTFVFENGDTIVTPSVTLPRGEKGDTGDKGDKGDKGDTGETGADGADGVSVTSATINASNHLIITLSNGNTIDAGAVSTTYAVLIAGDIGTLTDEQYNKCLQPSAILYKMGAIDSYKYYIKLKETDTKIDFIYFDYANFPQYMEIVEVSKSTKAFNSTTWNYKVAGEYLYSGSATQGQVPTADGAGNVTWEDQAGGGTTLNEYTYTLPASSTDTNAFKRVYNILSQAKEVVSVSDLSTSSPCTFGYTTGTYGQAQFTVISVYGSGGAIRKWTFSINGVFNGNQLTYSSNTWAVSAMQYPDQITITYRNETEILQ